MTNPTAVFDQSNPNWTRDAGRNYLFLKTIQQHMNNVLLLQGHLFLNEVFDALGCPRSRFGQTHGWTRANNEGDNFIDFGFMNQLVDQSDLLLTFNVQGDILDALPEPRDKNTD